MSEHQQTWNDFFANVRRSATWTNIFVFGINMPLGYVGFYLLILRNPTKDWLYFKIRIISIMAYLICSGSFIPMWAYEREIKRLHRLGYEQRPTVAAKVERWVNLGLCAFYIHSLSRMCDEAEGIKLDLILAGGCLCLWLIPIILFLSSIWSSTVRVRQHAVS